MDVETNGLIRGAVHPRIVQCSWGLYSTKGKLIELKDYVIKPNGWTMNGSDRCHGITYERATNEGVDSNVVLKEYKNDIDNICLKLVCHNMNVDVNVVLNELVMANMDIKKVETFCSMIETLNFCEITPMVRGQYKWPKLSESYFKLIKSEMENAHNSYYDVVNCAKCYFGLIKIGWVMGEIKESKANHCLIPWLR